MAQHDPECLANFDNPPNTCSPSCGLDALREKAAEWPSLVERVAARQLENAVLRQDKERLLGALNQIFLVCSRGGNMDLREIKSIVDAARAETEENGLR